MLFLVDRPLDSSLYLALQSQPFLPRQWPPNPFHPNRIPRKIENWNLGSKVSFTSKSASYQPTSNPTSMSRFHQYILIIS
jgi:hypothetical protein